MRPALELLARIDAYLNNELTPAEKEAFETELQNSDELKTALEEQIALREGIEYISLKQKTAKAYKGYRFTKLLKLWGGISLITLSAIGGFYWWSTQTHHELEIIEKTPPEAIIEEGKLEVGSTLPNQVFQINTQRDTVIETTHGTVIAIPANTFDTDSKEIELTIKEAITPTEIVKAGLSTFADSIELETAGMFLFEAEAKGEKVVIKEGKKLLVEVPTQNKKPDMKLWDGVVASNGEVNWVQPKELENYLTTVDISSLNFYPPGFEETLIELGYGNKPKQFKDSLFYSFYCEENINDFEKENITIISNYNREIATDTTIQTLYDTIIASNFLDQASTAISKYSNAKNLSIPSSILFEFTFQSYGGGKAYDHEMDIEILHGFADDKLNYEIVHESVSELDLTRKNRDYKKTVSLPLKFKKQQCKSINPSSIKAIWNKKFQNTLIATREFEDRLQVIYKSCNPYLLELYIKGMNQPLWKLDQKAAQLSSGKTKYAFEHFAARKEGRVKMNSSVAKKLNEYYQLKSKLYQEATIKTQKAFWEKETKKDQLASKKAYGKQNKDANRNWQNYQEELAINMKSMFKQAGLPDPTINRTANSITIEEQPVRVPRKEKIVPEQTYQFAVQTTGWKNLDRITADATNRRKSVTVNNDGKTAQLSYSELTISLDEEGFDYTMIYLTSNQINSYFKLTKNNGVYSYRVNDDLDYNFLAIGYKNGVPHFASKKNIKSGDHSFEFKKTTEKELDRLITKHCPNQSGQHVKEDQAYQKFVLQDQARKQRNAAMAKVRLQLKPVIFPCSSLSDSLTAEELFEEPSFGQKVAAPVWQQEVDDF